MGNERRVDQALKEKARQRKERNLNKYFQYTVPPGYRLSAFLRRYEERWQTVRKYGIDEAQAFLVLLKRLPYRWKPWAKNLANQFIRANLEENYIEVDLYGYLREISRQYQRSPRAPNGEFGPGPRLPDYHFKVEGSITRGGYAVTPTPECRPLHKGKHDHEAGPSRPPPIDAPSTPPANPKEKSMKNQKLEDLDYNADYWIDDPLGSESDEEEESATPPPNDLRVAAIVEVLDQPNEEAPPRPNYEIDPNPGVVYDLAESEEEDPEELNEENLPAW